MAVHWFFISSLSLSRSDGRNGRNYLDAGAQNLYRLAQEDLEAEISAKAAATKCLKTYVKDFSFYLFIYIIIFGCVSKLIPKII